MFSVYIYHSIFVIGAIANSVAQRVSIFITTPMLTYHMGPFLVCSHEGIGDIKRKAIIPQHLACKFRIKSHRESTS